MTSEYVSKLKTNSPKVTVVLGTQWGDEGKGKVIDLLSSEAQIVARFQGGNNAGHTVVVDDVSYDFHLLPCGIINPNCISVIGNGVVVNLPQLFDELERNEKKLHDSLHHQQQQQENQHNNSAASKTTGSETAQNSNVQPAGPIKQNDALWRERLYISDECHLVFQVHQNADAQLEADLQAGGERQIGTTRKGIGPTYSTKALRIGIRLDVLMRHFNIFETEFRQIIEYYRKQSAYHIDVDAELERYKNFAERIRPCVRDTPEFLQDSVEAGKKILIEGANGSLLDIDHGTYPYVTSSNCTIGGVLTGLGLPSWAIGHIYGVVKAYCTRVGDGPFPTELHDEDGKKLQECGHEIGVTTKRKRRCGWLDAFLLRYTHRLNGYTALALTKLDVLSNFDEVKICDKYTLDGERMTRPPKNHYDFARVKVGYTVMKGWKTDISHTRKFSDLPKEAQDYVRYIEKFVGVPIKWIGVGPERDSIIHMF